jgi:phenylalanyl-tRNA synthetase beta chain
MRVPLSWLAEYVALPKAVTSDDVDDAFVRVGLEVEDVVEVGAELTGPLVVGEVLEVTELTEFRKPVRWCRIDVGPHAAAADGGPRGIICGAPNIAAGQRVILALPGAALPGGFTITSRKTYGRVSDGMVCSARELGLGDDHTGILVLPPGAPVGADAIDYAGLRDTVYEIAVTPDRGYCFSVRGLARELAHGLGVAFRDPGAIEVPPATPPVPYPVEVSDPAGCDRFVGRAVRGLDPAAPTPLWMVRRLLLTGVRSISLAVDVTNYVMLELGQPMHAYDFGRLAGAVVVRRAAAGERLLTLDGASRVLDRDDLLITDDSGPIGLAGVMGGGSTEISPATADLFIECAHFDPPSVGRSSRRHRLSTEASKRFERGVDPAMAAAAAERAVRLLTELGGATADPGVLDIDHRRPIRPVHLDVSLPARTIGVDYPPSTVVDLLRGIGCAVDAEGGHELTVHPPSWRPDLTDPADLVEEVARLHGYGEIPSVLPQAPAGGGLTDGQRRLRAVSIALAVQGYVEIKSYPFVSPSVHEAFSLPVDDHRRRACRIANPLVEDEAELRTSLLPGLLAGLSRNVRRGARDAALFETGLVFHPESDSAAPRLGVRGRPSDTELAVLQRALPCQPRHVAAVLTGDRELPGWWGPARPAGWADAVEAARVVARAAGAVLGIRPGELAPWHPGRCAELFVQGVDGVAGTPGADGAVVIGHAGELHPRVIAALGLPARTCAMELSLDALPAAPELTAPVVSSYPPALLDVALVVDEGVPAAKVQRCLEVGAGPLLESLRLFDLYAGDQAGAGRKSLAFALVFRAADRTLTIEEATAARDAAVAEAGRRVGATIRS